MLTISHSLSLRILPFDWWNVMEYCNKNFYCEFVTGLCLSMVQAKKNQLLMWFVSVYYFVYGDFLKYASSTSVLWIISIYTFVHGSGEKKAFNVICLCLLFCLWRFPAICIINKCTVNDLYLHHCLWFRRKKSF